MRRAFLSGATGFLGQHMVDVLLEDDWQVTALCRDLSKAQPLVERGVDVRQGAIENEADVASAMSEGLDAVFHMAANTSTWRGDRERQFATNVDGTRNMLKAAAARGAQRFVHTSSTAVYGHHEGLKTEENAQLGSRSKVGYVKSKWLAEQLVKEAAAKGQSSVVLNPGHIIGAYDTHNWARMFFFVNQGKLPGIPPGGGSFANAREVAAGHLAAVERGDPGENYFLGGPRHSFLEVLTVIGQLLDKPIPKRTTPKALLLALGYLGDFVSRFTRKEPKISPEAAYFLCNDDYMDSTKAVRALDYKEVPVEDSLAQSLHWLRANGLLPR